MNQVRVGTSVKYNGIVYVVKRIYSQPGCSSRTLDIEHRSRIPSDTVKLSVPEDQVSVVFTETDDRHNVNNRLYS